MFVITALLQIELALAAEHCVDNARAILSQLQDSCSHQQARIDPRLDYRAYHISEILT